MHPLACNIQLASIVLQGGCNIQLASIVLQGGSLWLARLECTYMYVMSHTANIIVSRFKIL